MEGIESQLASIERVNTAGVLDLNGVKLYFREDKTRTTGYRCIYSVMFIPDHYEHLTEAELQARYRPPPNFALMVGVSATRSDAKIDLRKIDLNYLQKNYSAVKVTRYAAALEDISDEVPIERSERPAWFEIEFNLADFNPSNAFSVTIRGLTFNDQAVQIRPIEFSPQDKRGSEQLGEMGCPYWP